MQPTACKKFRIVVRIRAANTGVIQEPSERKKVVKSEVMKVNYCEPKSGDNCRNRKVHLSEFFFITFHHFFITYFLCMTPVLILLFDSSSSSSSFVIASSHDASFDDEEIF